MSLSVLKKNVFFELLNLAGRVFLVVRHSEAIDLGRKTFTEEEKKNGMTLVFTERMSIHWDAAGISTTLTFGSQPYRCFIPSADILAIYSPDLQVQLTTAGDEQAENSADSACCGASCQKQPPPRKKHGKVIAVDFAKRLRRTEDNPDKEDA
mgnify:CR=1 FL=1